MKVLRRPGVWALGLLVAGGLAWWAWPTGPQAPSQAAQAATSPPRPASPWPASGAPVATGAPLSPEGLRQREAEGYNRLAGISGVGGTMSQDLTRAGQQYATNAGNLMGSQGQVGANALLSGAAARQSAYGDVGQIWGRYFGG